MKSYFYFDTPYLSIFLSEKLFRERCRVMCCTRL